VENTDLKTKRTHRADGPNWRQSALLALGSLLLGLLFLSILLSKLDAITKYGLASRLYFILLIPLSLAAAFCLSGVLESVARYRGRHFNGVLTLGGPAVVFFLTLILGSVLVKPGDSFALIIFVVGSRYEPIALGKSCFVIVDFGQDRRREAINDKGQAFFPELPGSFRAAAVRIWVDDPRFEAINSNRTHKLDESVIYLRVRRRDDHIMGRVIDRSGNPINNATISVYRLSTITNDMGYFDLTVPGEQVKDSMELIVIVPNRSTQRYEITPGANPTTIIFD